MPFTDSQTQQLTDLNIIQTAEWLVLFAHGANEYEKAMADGKFSNTEKFMAAVELRGDLMLALKDSKQIPHEIAGLYNSPTKITMLSDLIFPAIAAVSSKKAAKLISDGLGVLINLSNFVATLQIPAEQFEKPPVAKIVQE